MPNDVFRAVDAVLVLGADDTSSPAGAAADGLISQYDLSNTVGRLTNVTISVAVDLKPFFELGRRYPIALQPGVIRVSGKADRAHINGAFLRLLLGDGAVSPPSAPNFVQPAFNVITSLADPSRPGQFTRLTLFGARFDNWQYSVPSDQFVMESVSFQALRISFEEA